MIKWICMIVCILLIASCSTENDDRKIISNPAWDEKNRQYSQAIAEEKMLFRQLLFEHRFDEIEKMTEQMDQNLTDVWDRQRIRIALTSMSDEPYFYDAFDHIASWCDQYPDSYLANTVLGYLYTGLAWKSRGDGYASEVSDDEWDEFRSNLKFAEETLTYAYELNPEFSMAATEMITVSMGLAYPRSEMEKWFQRAISVTHIADRTYDCKVRYLQPIWHGSVEELLAFAYETDDSGTPLFTVATTYGNTWFIMPARRTHLLPNKTFLKRAALAYERSLVKYPYRTVQRKFCAFFAVKSGNYSLAAKQFEYFSWEEKDKHLHLWKTEKEYKFDRAKSFRNSN